MFHGAVLGDANRSTGLKSIFKISKQNINHCLRYSKIPIVGLLRAVAVASKYLPWQALTFSVPSLSYPSQGSGKTLAFLLPAFCEM